MKQLLTTAFLLVAFLACAAPDKYLNIVDFTAYNRGWQACHIFSDPPVIALAIAAQRGDLTKIDRLVAQRVDVNAVGKDSVTPLAWAMIAKNKIGFERLLQQGADPNHMFADQLPLVHIAAKLDDIDWLRLCLKYRGDPNIVNGCEGIPYGRQTPIYEALVSSTFEQKLDLLIKARVNLAHQDFSGRTPLLHASLYCGLSRVYLLLEAGADFRIPADGGRDLAFDMMWELPRLAAQPDHERWAWREKILDFLEAHGADFGPAEAIIAKEFPKLVSLWEQDKKRRAARMKDTVQTNQSPL